MVTRIFFFLFLLTSFSLADCTTYFSNRNENFFNNLDYLDVKIYKKDKFFKRASRYYISTKNPKKEGQKNLSRFEKQYKTKEKARFYFYMKDGGKCDFPGTIRGHGDLDTHFELINGIPISSYRIKLDEGNFNNITRFILLRPKSRYYDNEIFITTLLQELGFLVPRTFKVKVKINNVITDFIFQENIKKEFLEYNKRIEGPLLEANEDLSKFNKLTLARISNKEWIKGINQNYLISLNAIKKLNYHRFNGYSFRIKSANYKNSKGLAVDETLRFSKKNLKVTEQKKIGMFQAAMFALGASHGLSYDDARFYYDPVYSIIEPIYYDGDSNILSVINYDSYTGTYKNSLDDWKKIKELNTDFKNLKEKSFRYNLRNQVVTELAIDNAIYVTERIKKIDKSKLLSNIKKNGFEKIDISQLEYLLQFIEERLEIISNSKVQEELNVQKNIYRVFYKEMGIENDLQLIFFENFLINNTNKLSIEECDYKLLLCENKIINENELLSLLEQNNLYKKNNSFLVIQKDEYQTGLISKTIRKFDENFEIINFSEDLKFIKNENVDIQIDENLKEIKIYFNHKKGRFIIFDSNLHSWKINMEISKINPNDKDILTKRITGCLTIIDSYLENIKIKANNFFCEDTVNIIRSKGSIEELDLSNSLSDSLDLDFSNISISNLKIFNAGNDCADFSFGNYFVKNIKIKNCGDKAISVGEKSILKIENLKAENSIIGLASKDSSTTEIKNINLNNVNTCFAAYNKKQEFFGGKINVLGNNSCKNYSKFIDIDKISEIVINNNNVQNLN
ncbi:hypothetical protein OAL74_02050 [Candidatus Pelagibacter sp.]|nr:hypothetical protein [Candidatus Pelagibacter sp.]